MDSVDNDSLCDEITKSAWIQFQFDSIQDTSRYHRLIEHDPLSSNHKKQLKYHLTVLFLSSQYRHRWPSGEFQNKVLQITIRSMFSFKVDGIGSLIIESICRHPSYLNTLKLRQSLNRAKFGSENEITD